MSRKAWSDLVHAIKEMNEEVTYVLVGGEKMEGLEDALADLQQAVVAAELTIQPHGE